MKKQLFLRNFYWIFLLSLFTCQQEKETPEKTLTLSPVRFIFDDNPAFARPGFDDSSWQLTDSLLERKFNHYDKKIAWFRGNFNLPEKWKEAAQKNDRLHIYIGRVGENDQVYLNGKLIGQNAENVSLPDTGKKIDFYPVVGKYYDIRRYYLPVKDARINWGGKNTLAIRVGNAPGTAFINSKDITIGLMPLLIKNKTAKFIHDEVNIYDFWKFKLDDNQQYATPAYNDNDWDSVIVRLPYTWQGYDSTGNAWYRKSINIPSSLKDFSDVKSHLRFQIGEFANRGEFFLNGNKLDEYKIKNYLNTYDIPINHPSIHWDEENVIAVRVIDDSQAPDVSWKGIVKGFYETRPVFFIKVPSALDYLELSAPDKLPQKVTKGQPMPVVLSAKNNAESFLSAQIKIKIIRKRDYSEVFNKKRTITLKAGEEKIINYDFIPEKVDNYLLTYSIGKNQRQQKKRSKICAWIDPACEDFTKNIDYKVDLKIKDACRPVPYHQLEINGLIGRWIDFNFNEGLMKLNQEKLLEGFYHRPGKTTPIGEFIGKYMVGQMKTLHYNNDPELKKRINREMGILIASQQKNGYLGTFNYYNRWTTWDVWVHKYVLLALLHYYQLTGYKPALAAADKIGEFLCLHLGNSPNQIDIINIGPFYGMPSTSVILPMTYLYQFTGKQKYIDFCQYIISSFEQKNGPKLLSVLLKTGKTNLAGGGKAYEQMSNLIGMLRLYQITGNKTYLEATKNAWEDILKNRLYITGSGSYHEVWHEAHDFPGTRKFNPCEGCVTVHWIFLNRVLFNLTGDPKYIDEIEKSMYNHLFAAQSPHTCGISYYTVLEGKRFYNKDQAICCNSSVLREIARIPQSIYARTEKDELAILLYNQGKFYDYFNKNKKVNFLIDTDYPKSGNMIISVKSEQNINFSLKLRVPKWTKQYTARIGDTTFTGKPGTFLTINKDWKGTEKIFIELDMNPTLLKGKKRYPDYFAIKYGPQILAIDKLVNPGIHFENVFIKNNQNVSIKNYNGKLPDKWIGNQAFISTNITTNNKKSIILVPFADAGQFGNNYFTWIKQHK